MKDTTALTITSLLSILLLTFHLTDDIVRGFEKGGVSGMFFWVWTLIALGVTATFSVVLAARGLWSLRRGQPA